MANASTVVKKLTPVLMVQAIEPCLPLWVDRLGWSKVAEVPHGDTLGFVILVKDGVEIMYQTFASVEDDTGPFTHPNAASVGLFLEVADLEAIVAQIDGLEVALPRRRTAYGMDEIGIREPGGHLVLFAQPAP
jgi:hypothetical protein